MWMYWFANRNSDGYAYDPGSCAHDSPNGNA